MEDVPRRILCILENAGAGSGRHVLDLSRGLIERGHHVTLLFSRARLEGWFERELATIPHLVAATIDMRSGMGLSDLASLRAVRRYLQEHGPFDIVHGHSSKGGALVRLGAVAGQAVRVYTPHALYTLGCEPRSLRRRFFALLERVLARRCEGIICVSAAERRHAIECGLPADKLFVVPNGLAPLPAVERAVVRSELGLGDEDVAIGFVGRLARQKAVHRLIGAFAAMRSEHDSARLVVVGDGPAGAAAKAQAQRAGVADAVVWTGAVPGQRMMGAFDIFACCSLYEAFPYVFLEAMARGLPIVSTRVGGVDEVLSPGVNGLLVEQDDPDSLARALLELVRDGERRLAMGRESLRRAAAFDVDAMVDRTVQVYSHLLARREETAERD